MADRKGFTTAGFRELITKIGETFIKKTDTTEVSTISIDDSPTASSTNLVTSGGVYTAVNAKSVVSGTSSGTNWSTITINGTSKNIPQGGSGTVTSVSVSMNGATKGTVTTSGTIDLGTVITSHQDISGKENTSNKSTSISSSSTDTQYPSAKAVYSYHDSTKYDASNPNGYTSNTGTVTSIGVSMNGSSKGTITTSGTIDLGTVITAHQDISGKADKTATVSNVAYDTTNDKFTKTINGTTTDIVTVSTLKTDMALNNVENKSSATIRGEITASNIPSLDASKITSGTFADARIASASTWNNKQDALVFNTAYDPTTNKVATMADINASIVSAIEGSY